MRLIILALSYVSLNKNLRVVERLFKDIGQCQLPDVYVLSDHPDYPNLSNRLIDREACKPFAYSHFRLESKKISFYQKELFISFIKGNGAVIVTDQESLKDVDNSIAVETYTELGCELILLDNIINLPVPQP